MKKSMLCILVSCCMLLGVQAVYAQEPYHFTFAYGPWDLAEGRIDPSEQPNDPYFQYIEKTYGTVPLTTSWEWEGMKGFIQGLRLYLASGELPEAMRPLDATLMIEMVEAGKILALDDLLAEKPERADVVERWIAELDAWNRARPRLSRP